MCLLGRGNCAVTQRRCSPCDTSNRRSTMTAKKTTNKATKAPRKAKAAAPDTPTTETTAPAAPPAAAHAGRRVAYVDTEQGTAFYGQAVPARTVHPAAFDFDVLHSRSITEVLAAFKKLDLATHGVIVIDSITHLWDACKAAYAGKLNR